jgi:hypothetical protein
VIYITIPFLAAIVHLFWIARGRDIAPLNRKLRSIAEMHAWVEENVGAMFSSR